MKLRKKTAVVLALTFAVLIAVQYTISQIIFLDSFSSLEKQDTLQNVERVRNALFADWDSFDSFVYDWAAWDDTYQFIQDANNEYVQSNLVDEMFIGSNLNLILYVNNSGEIVYGKAFDQINEEETVIPEEIVEHLTTDNDLLNHNDVESSVNGFLLLSDGPILIASRPITTSNEEGPILGSLIMGRYFDSTQLEKIAETTQIALEMQLVNNLQMPANFDEAISQLSTEQNNFIKPVNSDLISGYTMIEDIYGEPCMVLKAELPRSIYNQGNLSITYFVTFLLSTGIASSVVIILFLEKTILSRLAQLSDSVKKIVPSKENGVEQVTVKGKDDEITDLADEINKMLTTLEQFQNKLKVINEKLSVVGNFTRHDVRNKLATILNNVYVIKKKMKNEDPQITDRLKSIESSIDQVTKIFDFAKTYEMLGVEELDYISVEKFVNEVTMFHNESDIKIVDECQGLTVLADSLLRQLFYNLVDDTKKHAEHATQIRIYFKEEENQLKLVYEDNGIGISIPEKEQIFEEGYGKGTGYGLYLIRRICETYGWKIQETGKPGEGARFVMTIPKINKNEEKNYIIKQDNNKTIMSHITR